MIQDKSIDGGKPFDWGRTSELYAKYRDIYPPKMYNALLERGLCVKGQRVLDLGTGTGVLPRALYPHGASFVGADISPEQITQARRLSAEAGMDIEYIVAPAEEVALPPNSLDVVTACQCFHYFTPGVLLPRLAKMLKPGAPLVVLFMEWLPFESEIALKSEQLVLKYNPGWSGAGSVRRPVEQPAWATDNGFTQTEGVLFDVSLPFTRESWHGRMVACRGVAASLNAGEVAAFEAEHLALLAGYPQTFEIPHFVTLRVLRAAENGGSI